MVIPDEIRKCVVFLAFNSNSGPRLAGTAFFVSYPIKEVEGKLFFYLITAKHVIEKINENSADNKAFIRFNTRTDGSEFVVSNINQWKFHPTDNSVDIAILAWAPPQDKFDYLSIPLDMALTKEIVLKENINVGDEVFLTGLFSNHYGKKKNLPIIRVGNIAMMPEEKVYTSSLGKIDAYLIEARSIGGLSGSPIFVYLGHIRPDKKGNVNFGVGRKIFYWLGVMHGHWDIPSNKSDVVITDQNNFERINMGIAIVVPAIKALEILDSSEFAEQREKEIERLKKEKVPVADNVIVGKNEKN